MPSRPPPPQPLLLPLTLLLLSAGGSRGSLSASSETAANDILARYPGQDDYISPGSSVTAVAGGTAELPCDLRSLEPDDPALLVLWYRSGIVKPIYSYDVRSGQPSHWKNTVALGHRASYQAARCALLLHGVLPGDANTYTCRVDFRISPTLTYKVNLTVIIPPERIGILSTEGVEVGPTVGPLVEGEALRLTCRAEGGNPQPEVTWWQDGRPLDDSFYSSSLSDHNNISPSNRNEDHQDRVHIPSSPLVFVSNTVRATPLTMSNSLHVEPLGRDNLGRDVTCRASNTNLTEPMEASVTIDMILSPIWVRLLTSQEPLVAGRRYDMTCQAVGARPPASLIWFLDDQILQNYTEDVSPDGNVTTSVLTLEPGPASLGRLLTCRSQPPHPRLAPVRDTWPLLVYYPPFASLKPGRSLNLSGIEEGDDVYFECVVDASPPIYKIVWTHRERPLHHNVSAGVILSNQSLVVQSVDRSASGDYTCTASNIEGDGVSNTVTLNVKYAPVCGKQEWQYRGASLLEQIVILCILDALPPPHHVTWTFNNTGESIRIAQEQVSLSGRRSTVSYTPKTELDYGTLLCWGTNAVGLQKRPCVFHIFPAGPPDPVHNCSQFNLSATDVNVRCAAGFDGGLPQTFVLELYDEITGRLAANVSSSMPVLWARSLPSSSIFSGVVYPINSKGRGEIAAVSAVTLRDQAEKRTAAMKPPPSLASSSLASLATPIIGVVAGVALALALVVGVAITIMKLKTEAGRMCTVSVRIRGAPAGTPGSGGSPSDIKHQSIEGSNYTENEIENSSSAHFQDNNPDLIKQQPSTWSRGRFSGRGGSEEPLLHAPASPSTSTPAGTLRFLPHVASVRAPDTTKRKDSSKASRRESSCTSSESFGVIIHHHHQDPPPPAPQQRSHRYLPEDAPYSSRGETNQKDTEMFGSRERVAHSSSVDDTYDINDRIDNTSKESRQGSLHYTETQDGSYQTLPARGDRINRLFARRAQEAIKSTQEQNPSVPNYHLTQCSASDRANMYKYKQGNVSKSFGLEDNGDSTRTFDSFSNKGVGQSVQEEGKPIFIDTNQDISGRRGSWSQRTNPLHDHLLRNPNKGERTWNSSAASTPSPTHSAADCEVIVPLLNKERESSV